MKRLVHLILFSLVLLCYQSCDKADPVAQFEDLERQTIYDYIVENQDQFSMFLKILEVGQLDKTMSAYNPDGNDYTLFLPTNSAIEAFIREENRYASFDELIADQDFVAAMARYHVVNMGIITNDFPYGALPELNLQGQYLTVGFVVEEDTSYYKINNIAPVQEGNIEVSNGYIHIISRALTPITFSAWQWLGQNPGYTIFRDAVQATGFDSLLNAMPEEGSTAFSSMTLLMEPDTVYNRNRIFSLNDLAMKISSGQSDYKSSDNPLNIFVGYHILQGNYFLSDFEGNTTNYVSHGDAPVLINGEGVEMMINKGKTKFDTIVSGTDTTIIDYVTFYFDQSNILTLTGALHSINQVMTRQPATAARQTFQFFEESLFNEYRSEGGTFIIEDKRKLNVITWTGGNDKLTFVKKDDEDEDEQAWNKDYILIDGDFSISYTLPLMVQGTYDVSIRAHAYSASNALVEVFIDGVKTGGLVDLTSGGSSSNPYAEKKLGSITFLKYEPHTVTVKTLIPGTFYWDNVDFNIK